MIRLSRLVHASRLCRWGLCLLFALGMGARADEATVASPVEGRRSPNVVLIFTDDQGYGDVGCYGGRHVTTPHLDRLATQGVRFTNFYVAQAVCGASRAALLTGCLPNRIGILGAPSHSTKFGIHDQETLLSEIVKQKQYATAIYGKWHLGHQPKFLPQQHGFDQYFGLPYSNDMWPFHPEGASFPDLPMIDGSEVINPSVTSEDQRMLTHWYTERAVSFIGEHHSEPFFLYLAHSMPHVPLHMSDAFRGRSGKGDFADVIAEIDDSVGRVLGALHEWGIEENTLVIFTTDNGPWLSYGNHAGSAGPLREGKGTTFEGGVRVPCLMRWPGRIPHDTVCHELAATIDILPTVAALLDVQLPEHPIDGRDIWPLITGYPGARTPHASYPYYWGKELQAIRAGRWKLHFPHDYRALTGQPGRDGKPAGYTQQRTDLALYDLESDIGESTDLKARYPDVVGYLQQLAEGYRVDLGDALQKRAGAGVRPPGMAE